MTLGYDDLTRGQTDAADWLVYRTEALLALQVGYGKSVITLTAYAKLREMLGDLKMLLVSTKSICHLTWAEEIAKWTHLPPLTYGNASGCKVSVIESQPDILAINFESLVKYLDGVEAGDFVLPDVLVIDESSKMKAHGTHRVAKLAGLRRITKKNGVKQYQKFPGYVHRFKRRWLLSATPTPESYADLWAQEACMSVRRRLGENITNFRDQYCTRDRSGFGWDVIPAVEPLIEEKLKYVMYLPRETDFLDLEQVTHREVLVPWASEARVQYKEMEDELEVVLENLDGDTPMDEVEVIAPNAGVLLGKLRQLCSGFIYDADGNAIPTNTPNAKLDALDLVIERIGDTPLLVFTQFRAEMRAISRRYREAQIGLPPSLDDWNNRRGPRLLVLHPASAGHGLNLQFGTNICLYYTLPHSYEQWHQSWGRIQRRGQRFAVSALRFGRPNSVCQDTWKIVSKKGAKLRDFLEHMRARRHGN
jgi:SNF2 family DNA or RNA helicase